MDSQQTAQFNERLNQWVASQGFWFQLRYSLSHTGLKGAVFYQALRMVTRLLVLVLLVALGFGVYLLKRTDTQGFRDYLDDRIAAGLGAKRVETRGVARVQGELNISRLAAEGGPETYFTSLEARNMRFRMGLLDGLTGVWEPGQVTISRLEMEVAAGADDEQAAEKMARVLFAVFPTVDVRSFEVLEADLRWGYSDRTRGEIVGTQLRAQRYGGGWRLSMKGGLFSQNCLRRLQIVELVAVVDRSGVVFEKAEMRQASGSVDFADLRIRGGVRPEVEGVVKIRGLALESLIPATARDYVEGSISSDWKVSGSTNTAEGLAFAGQVALDGVDSISVRDRIHLLRALTVVDVFNNYRRLDFREGSFEMVIRNGGVELNRVDLRAGDLVHLRGALRIRQPTLEEQNAMAALAMDNMPAPLFASDPSGGGTEASVRVETQDDFTLRRAAREARRAREAGQEEGELSLFEELGLSAEARRLRELEAERLSRMLRYEGMFRISLMADSFERAEVLKSLHPVDPGSGRIPLDVPIEGGLHEITLKQAELLYQQGRR